MRRNFLAMAYNAESARGLRHFIKILIQPESWIINVYVFFSITQAADLVTGKVGTMSAALAAFTETVSAITGNPYTHTLVLLGGIAIFWKGVDRLKKHETEVAKVAETSRSALISEYYDKTLGVVGSSPDMIKDLVYLHYLATVKDILGTQICWYEGRFSRQCACARDAAFDGNFFMAGKNCGPFAPHPELSGILQRFGDGFNADQWTHPPSKLLDQAITVRTDLRDKVNELLKETTAATAKMRHAQFAIESEIIKVGNKVTEYGKGQ